MTNGVEVTGPSGPRYDQVLTEDALEFLAILHREFDGRRRQLLEARRARYDAIAAGGTLGFREDTEDVREGDWPRTRQRPRSLAPRCGSGCTPAPRSRPVRRSRVSSCSG